MNKPAPKEPSMDEILSSIRQIIADDDAAGVPRRPTIQAAPPPMQAAPARQADSLDRDLSDMLEDDEPLALSSAQIIAGSSDDDIGGFSFDSILADTESAEDDAPAMSAAPSLVDPEDIGFAIEEADDGLPSFDPPPMRKIEPTPAPAPRAEISRPASPPPQPELAQAAPRPEPRPQPTIAQAAPMPDPTLSSDMAEQLLEPATQAAVRGSITKLNGLGLGNAGATVESLMRDMLRPMLKEWLDENLPSVVERMVEKEIARVSRGE